MFKNSMRTIHPGEAARFEVEAAAAAALDASIARGMADAEAGRTKSAEEVFEHLCNKLKSE